MQNGRARRSRAKATTEKLALVQRHLLCEQGVSQRVRGGRGYDGSLARRLLHGAGMEENMTSIKLAVQEWGYPATVLISWMMATAYTLSRII